MIFLVKVNNQTKLILSGAVVLLSLSFSRFLLSLYQEVERAFGFVFFFMPPVFTVLALLLSLVVIRIVWYKRP